MAKNLANLKYAYKVYCLFSIEIDVGSINATVKKCKDTPCSFGQ